MLATGQPPAAQVPAAGPASVKRRHKASAHLKQCAPPIPRHTYVRHPPWPLPSPYEPPWKRFLKAFGVHHLGESWFAFSSQAPPITTFLAPSTDTSNTSNGGGWHRSGLLWAWLPSWVKRIRSVSEARCQVRTRVPFAPALTSPSARQNMARLIWSGAVVARQARRSKKARQQRPASGSASQSSMALRSTSPSRRCRCACPNVTPSETCKSNFTTMSAE